MCVFFDVCWNPPQFHAASKKEMFLEASKIGKPPHLLAKPLSQGVFLDQGIPPEMQV